MRQKTERRRTMVPPLERLNLTAILGTWMLILEKETGLHREDILFAYRRSLLGQQVKRFHKTIFYLPKHHDELTDDELFTFMYDIRWDVRERFRIQLEFNVQQFKDNEL